METYEATPSRLHAWKSKALPSFKRTEKPLSVAQRAPFEVLDLIFDHIDVAQDQFKRSQGVSDGKMPWISLVHVCRQWYGPAVGRLYASIDLKTEGQVVRLYDTLRRGPHFRSLVRALHLPLTFSEAPAPAPVPQTHALYCRVINLVNDLEDLSVPTKFLTKADIKRIDTSWDGPRIVLPIAPNRHHTLHALTINCNSHLGPTIFPHSLKHFTNLRYLCLVSLSLSRRVHPGSPLPLLETIIFMYEPGTEQLDDWMCASPKLTTIGFWKTCPTGVIPRVITMGRITRVEVLFSVPNSVYILALGNGVFSGRTLAALRVSWLKMCISLRQLRISGDVFIANCHDLPVDLEELRIELMGPPYPAVEIWQRYFKSGRMAQRLVLSFHILEPWSIDAGQRARLIAVGTQVAVSLEYPENSLPAPMPQAAKRSSSIRGVVQSGRKRLRA